MKPLSRLVASLIAAAIALLGIGLILFAWHLPPFANRPEMTENAYVRGQVTILSPQVSGYVAEVTVKDFERVKAGQVLLKIDDRIYRQKVKQAEANLKAQEAQIASLEQKRRSAEAKLEAGRVQITSAESALKTAEATLERNRGLAAKTVVSQSALEQSESMVEQARAALAVASASQKVLEQDVEAIEVSRQGFEAAVDGARAALELARIDLANTAITAPADGRLGEVGARKGAFVTMGTQLMAVVLDKVWVTANFKETQLPDIRVGQQVTFTVDALDHHVFRGRIESLSPATGSEFSVLKPDNATGNFTKVAQRVPIRIAIEEGQAGAGRLEPGMSVVVTVPKLPS
ncbi:HlyD family secretion protein [Gellertiella hungarica]|uniref:Multidrug resistance efflux pump n=1 Tax=Gellertiella hungarica TaxID=1572859 RepID=A0A7W6J7A2_9HYPH|nr:HlyD family secretion protein [Gellertiella hungarica]MBB4066118.1 multidrug resistance efflux pump [Gellertiella hungarica]